MSFITYVIKSIILFISTILYPKPTFPNTGCQWLVIDNVISFGHYVGKGYFRRWLDYTDYKLDDFSYKNYKYSRKKVV